MFGPHIFSMYEREIAFMPEPAQPSYLVPEDGRVTAALLGEVFVTYRLDGGKSTFRESIGSQA